MEQLAQMVEREDFLTLESDYGQHVADGSTDTITIVRGGQARTVSLHFLGNWAMDDHEKLREPSRAVRVFQFVRSWFDNPNAANLTEYYQSILEAARNGS